MRPFSQGGGPLYQQIARQVVSAVNEGLLRPGDRLPAQRDLAQLLGVDLTTVTRAYTELRRAGLLDAQGAGGTYIASAASEGSASVDLSMNVPPLIGSMLGRLLDAGMRNVREQLVRGSMSYQVGPGLSADREAGAKWLEPMLGQVPADRVVVCPGAQSAIAAVILARSRPGDCIAADSLTYPGLLAAARVLDRDVVGVASDADGMSPAELERVCNERRPALLYLVPTIQNPTATTLSAVRRRELQSVAAKYSVAIIEDDPYWLLAGDAPAPVAALAPEAPTFYISTLSKCLAPGLRTAYVVMPEEERFDPFLDALRGVALMAPPAMTSMATLWIREGLALEMLGKIREELSLRQQLVSTFLRGRAKAHPFGLHAWLSLPEQLDQYRLIRIARDEGIDVVSSDAFNVDGPSPNAIRLSLGGAADRVGLEIALRKLADLLAVGRTSPVAAIV